MAQVSAFNNHNHNYCIQTALNTAAKLCQQNNVRLTELRRTVLELIWDSHKPLGAYTLMDLLQQHLAEQGTSKPIAPPTVYRALDFLLEQGLIHRINSLNAFIGCCEPGSQHSSQFLICRQCENTEEITSAAVSNALENYAAQTDFNVEQGFIEMLGLCQNCQGTTN